MRAMVMRFRLCLDAALIALLLLVGVGGTLAAALGPVPQSPGAPVLIIAPPWSVGAPALAALAGGRALGPVTAPLGALAVFDTAPPVARLRRLGAWTVRDARAIASFCGGLR